MKTLIAAIAALSTVPATAQSYGSSAANDPTWQKAAAEIAANAQRAKPQKRAQNVILVIGDGMGISTLMAARIYQAQLKAKAAGGTYPGFEGGEENLLSFERLPNRALVKTYNTNAQVPDSAGTATAFTSGYKTRIGVLGITSDQGLHTCATPEKFPKSIAALARDRGMGLGIVTTTRITHATPGAMYAHTPSRDWESTGRDLPADARKAGCQDIASQLIGFKGGADVVLGGGLAKFKPTDAGGQRDDGRDLIAEWQQAYPAGTFVDAAQGFRQLDAKSATPVLGLFNNDHLAYNVDADRTKEPSLAEMAGFAVRKLEARAKRSGKGYVLMVEGGRIDHGHHMSNAHRALDETAQLSDAVDEILKTADLSNTLIMVTADHSHVFTVAGYPPRGNPILGYSRMIEGGEGQANVDSQGNMLDQQGRPMTTLGYANGPLSTRVGKQELSSDLDPQDKNFLQPKTFFTGSESHGGEDVALFATGPGSDLANGTIEQNGISHIAARALGWK